jgi:hypothetical protein
LTFVASSSRCMSRELPATSAANIADNLRSTQTGRSCSMARNPIQHICTTDQAAVPDVRRLSGWLMLMSVIATKLKCQPRREYFEGVPALRVPFEINAIEASPDRVGLFSNQA